MDTLPIVAVLGQTQVGKSSLVNRLLGASLLPTTGVGTSRSKVVTECLVGTLPGAGGEWTLDVSWLPRERLLFDLRPGMGTVRSRFLSEKLGDNGPERVRIDLERLPEGSSAAGLWAAGNREVSEQLADVVAGWPSALSDKVRLRGAGQPAMVLADLPGLDAYDDLGSLSTEAWLKEHAQRVAAVVCVVAKSGLGVGLVKLLQRFWPVARIESMMHLVSTHADELVRGRAPGDREKIARSLRAAGARKLAEALGLAGETEVLRERVFVLDPRFADEETRPVEFEGELLRLAAALGAVRVAAAAPPSSRSTPVHDGAGPECAAPESPIAARAGEQLRVWLNRVLLPKVDGATWTIDRVSPTRERAHLDGRGPKGAPTRILTIWGTGEARTAWGRVHFGPSPPVDTPTAHLVISELTVVIRRLGISVIE